MIKVMTDNAANLPPELRAQYGITELCLTYTIDGEPVDISKPFDGHAFYEAMRKGAEVKTSMITPLAARDAMEPVLDRGDDVLYVGLSGGVSGTCWGVSVVAQELRERYPELKVLTVDTLCASMGQGLLVWLTVQELKHGATLEEAAKYAEDNRLHLCHWFTVDDLFFLKRGGRVSAATALVGSALGIKPVLHVDNEGHLINVSKARGRKNSILALVDRMERSAIEPEKQTVFISHGDCLADAEFLAQEVRRRLHVPRIEINYVGPVIGAHSGPGTLALFFLGTAR